MITKKVILSILPLVILGIFNSCNDSVNESGNGTLLIKLTDAPFPINLVSEANVTISMIEARRDQSESDGNPFLILSEEEFTYNLLDLQNGVTAELVKIEVPVGDYNLVRLYVTDADIKLKDGTVYNLKIPSGDETGIKIYIEPAIRVTGGLTSELLLDFDVSQSFVVRGNPKTLEGINGFIFQPVIRAANLSTSGSITGKVIDNSSAALGDAYIWIEYNTNTYSTHTDELGLYTLSGVPEGIYTVNATKKTTEVEYDTVSVENVEMVAGNVIQLDDFILTLIP